MSVRAQGPKWSYPALLAIIGRNQRPGLGELRSLVRRLRREAGLRPDDPVHRRQWVRRTVSALLTPEDVARSDSC